MNSGITTGTSARRTVTAFFDSRTDAEEAVARLQSAGLARDNVRLVPGNEKDTDRSGTIGTQSAGGGAGGFWNSLSDLFLPDEDRHTYAEGLRRGGYLLSVSVTDAEYDRVVDILDDEGTIDIDERADTWRSQGWSGSSTSEALGGSTPNIAPGTSTTGSGALAVSGMGGPAPDTRSGRGESDEVIPVAEETLSVGKRDVSHGRVRVRSYVVETPVNEQVNLREEHVEIERRPVDRAMTGVEDPFQERTIEVEERSEEAVVSKVARVKEELVVKKDVEQRTETVSDTVRSTEVEVEDEHGNTVSTSGTKN